MTSFSWHRFVVIVCFVCGGRARVGDRGGAVGTRAVSVGCGAGLSGVCVCGGGGGRGGSASEPGGVLTHRRDVVRRAADRLLALLARLEAAGQAEVPQAQLPARGDEDVAQLEVPVDDVVRVEVGQRGRQLEDVLAHLGLRERAARAQQLGERLALAELEQDVHVVGVLEAPPEAHDVPVRELPVDADLGEQLGLGARAGEAPLADHLAGEGLAGGEVGEHVHRGEAALAEGAALGVATGRRARRLARPLDDDRRARVHHGLLLLPGGAGGAGGGGGLAAAPAAAPAAARGLRVRGAREGERGDGVVVGVCLCGRDVGRGMMAALL